MFGFFKSKAGVFVICVILLAMALGLLALTKASKKPVPVAPAKPIAEKANVVNPAGEIPAVIAQANSTVEQAKHRPVQDNQVASDVPVVRRAMPIRGGDSTGSYEAQHQSELKEVKGPTGQSNPTSAEANYHEGLRLSPLPRRQAQPSAADGTATAPRQSQYILTPLNAGLRPE